MEVTGTVTVAYNVGLKTWFVEPLYNSIKQLIVSTLPVPVIFPCDLAGCISRLISYGIRRVSCNSTNGFSEFTDLIKLFELNGLCLKLL